MHHNGINTNKLHLSSLDPEVQFLTFVKIHANNNMLFKITLCRINFFLHNMSRVVRKPAFCKCENKDADQLRGNREADQRLCKMFSLHR